MAITDLPPIQRSRGAAAVALSGRTARLADLRQDGSAKAILPAVHGGLREVVFLNTSGGLTGGDSLHYALDVPPDSRAVATTQTAERAYDAGGGLATVGVRLTVGAGGWLDWLPQETILFDGAAVDRTVTLDLGEGAGGMLVESVVLGRQAMGETLRGLRFRDHRSITRAGRPLFAEPMEIDTATLTRSGSPALLGGARAFATLVLVAPQAADLLSPLKAVLDQPGVETAASAFDGRLVARFLAWDGMPLRRQLIRAIRALRPGPLPRVWQE
jgi:urease accessory protein